MWRYIYIYFSGSPGEQDRNLPWCFYWDSYLRPAFVRRLYCDGCIRGPVDRCLVRDLSQLRHLCPAVKHIGGEGQYIPCATHILFLHAMAICTNVLLTKSLGIMVEMFVSIVFLFFFTPFPKSKSGAMRGNIYIYIYWNQSDENSWAEFHVGLATALQAISCKGNLTVIVSWALR